MKLFIALCLVATVAADFGEFQKKHGKKYESPEHAKKAEAHYKRNKNKIDEHNARFAAGEVSFSLGENQFTDQNITEVAAQILGRVASKQMRALPGQLISTFPAGAASRDYTSSMQPIGDQGQCGSCWAFATTAVLESLYKRNSPSYNYVMSPQYLVDCNTENFGCGGGNSQNAMQFLVSNGMPLGANYPYKGVQSACKSPLPAKVAPRLPTSVNFYSLNGNEAYLKNIVSQDGPVVAGIYANTDAFIFYSSGILNDATATTNCGALDHDVVVVGYGTDAASGQNYWLIRNSWGTTWGAAGYVKVPRGFGNNRGIACDATYFKI